MNEYSSVYVFLKESKSERGERARVFGALRCVRALSICVCVCSYEGVFVCVWEPQAAKLVKQINEICCIQEKRAKA